MIFLVFVFFAKGWFSLSAASPGREPPTHGNEHRAVPLAIKADSLSWELLGSAPLFPLGLLPDQPHATKTGILRSEKGGILWGSPQGMGKEELLESLDVPGSG